MAMVTGMATGTVEVVTKEESESKQAHLTR